MVCACIPAVATAQAQRTDPDATSPAGVIYEIPFDHARKDAAPMPGGQSGGGGADATPPTTTTRAPTDTAGSDRSPDTATDSDEPSGAPASPNVGTWVGVAASRALRR
jgi:hypothetical protein